MTQIPETQSPPRHLGVVREVKGEHAAVTPGRVLVLPVPEAERLKKAHPGAFLDLTPPPMAIALSWVFGSKPFDQKTQSTVLLVPCRACHEQIPGARMGLVRRKTLLTVCKNCNDTGREVVANPSAFYGR